MYSIMSYLPEGFKINQHCFGISQNKNIIQNDMKELPNIKKL